MVKNLTQIMVVPFFAGKWYQFRPALKIDEVPVMGVERRA